MRTAFADKSEKGKKKRDRNSAPGFPSDQALSLSGAGASAGLPLFLSQRVQPKLIVGPADDPLEREADQVAARVTQGGTRFPAQPPATQRIQRKCNGCNGAHKCEACAEEKAEPVMRVHAKSTDSIGWHSFPGASTLNQSGGTPLSRNIRGRIEPVLAADLSHVRVHSDAFAQQASRSLQAKAFTHENHIWLGQDQSAEDVELMAHESAHVAQQTGTVRRKPDKKPAKGPPTAADAPKLTLSPSTGDACACLVVVHNDEENARKTAQLMHDNCAYNLALLEPKGGREIPIAGPKSKDKPHGTHDPNEFFPEDIAEQCTNDEQGCRDFLATKSGTTNKDEITKFVEIQFFLTISDCSKAFSLPVIALHNNDITDTEEYRRNKDKKGVADLKMDVDKDNKEVGEDQIAKLKQKLKDKFGGAAEKKLVETKGQTNIFRWCASKDLSKCHIGDPDHPDNITWVTNQKDFEALSTKDINVALQTDTAASAGSESEGDLSTLFLILRDLTFEKLFTEEGKKFIEGLARIKDMKDPIGIVSLVEFFRLVWDVLTDLLAKLFGAGGAFEKTDKLRYINIETPGKGLKSQSDAERIRNYHVIADNLKTLGLHCCGDDPAAAEKKIEEGLALKKKT